MKKRILLILSAVLLVAVVASVVFIKVCTQPPSVKSIEARSVWSDDITLAFKQVGCSGYSVKKLDKEEPIYIYVGEKVVEYTDDMGEHRVKIAFSDIKSWEKLKKRFAPGETHVIESDGKKLNLMWHLNADHGIDIFIGFEENFSVEDVPYTKLDKTPFKTVKIVLKKEE